MYPGRLLAPEDPAIDHDCNGIAGVDEVRGRACDGVRPARAATCAPLSWQRSAPHRGGGIRIEQDGVSYEARFCANASTVGLVFLGDSATAHFSIPVRPRTRTRALGHMR